MVMNLILKRTVSSVLSKKLTICSTVNLESTFSPFLTSSSYLILLLLSQDLNSADEFWPFDWLLVDVAAWLG